LYTLFQATIAPTAAYPAMELKNRGSREKAEFDRFYQRSILKTALLLN
jgi:hypothetical protein